MTTQVMNETSAAAQTSAGRTTGRHAAPAPAGNGLDGALPTGSNQILHAHVLGRAIQHLQTRYAAVEQDLVRSTVHAAYRELNRTARLKTYLPTLAVREAEGRLRRLATAAGSHPGAHGTTDTVGHRAVITAAPLAA